MKFWAQVLSAVGKRIDRHCFETWFLPIIFESHDDYTIFLKVPNENFKKCLLENYAALLQDAVTEAVHKPMSINVSVETSSLSAPTLADPPAPAGPTSVLNPRYVFSSFVVGASNQFAHAAALAVADRPSKAYNPLYIYGGVGLGKTHLMHAIGHRILEKNPRLRLIYMSSEQFMNELIIHLRYDKMLQFRETYRNMDVLLMDDIQFMSGNKERTQEEFFHTFNALYHSQKQIVISSDCPPREIPTLEERLHSRFEWGLIADIQPPDLETKLAILRRKAEAILPGLPDEVAVYISGSIRSNIRELEGALIRLSARASLDGVSVPEIDVGYTKDVLKNLLCEETRSITSEAIIRAVADHFGLKPTLLKSKSNSRRIAEPRQIAMFVCKKMTRLSLPQIGREFGGKHHTTVLHSIRKVESMIVADRRVSSIVDKIMRSL